MAFETVAVFGADGQIGQHILEKLSHNFKANFNVLAFIHPEDQPSCSRNYHKSIIKQFDLNELSREGLAKDLQGVDAVISALGGKALDAQPTIQDAAADAGVKRFYPSEYDIHHIYQKPGDLRGYLHPIWNQKHKYATLSSALSVVPNSDAFRLNERAVLHPAVQSGKMSYTVIGCGDFYNRDREPVWCSWMREDVEEYILHIIGDPETKADFTNLDDFAAYLVETLLHPAKSENQYLNFVSDTISHMGIAESLRKHTGRTVKIDYYPVEKMHEVAADPTKAPQELRQSAFPPDFWFMVKGMQAEGRSIRPRGQVHNYLFPDVQPTTFDKYFQQKFKGEQT